MRSIRNVWLLSAQFLILFLLSRYIVCARIYMSYLYGFLISVFWLQFEHFDCKIFYRSFCILFNFLKFRFSQSKISQNFQMQPFFKNIFNIFFSFLMIFKKFPKIIIFHQTLCGCFWPYVSI